MFIDKSSGILNPTEEGKTTESLFDHILNSQSTRRLVRIVQYGNLVNIFLVTIVSNEFLRLEEKKRYGVFLKIKSREVTSLV